MKYIKTNQIVSRSNLIFYPMTAPNTGCIAVGKLTSGFDITVTGGNVGQHADGVESFLVEVVDNKYEEPRIVTKRNMNNEELSLLIEHHLKSRFKRRRKYAR